MFSKNSLNIFLSEKNPNPLKKNWFILSWDWSSDSQTDFFDSREGLGDIKMDVLLYLCQIIVFEIFETYKYFYGE